MSPSLVTTPAAVPFLDLRPSHVPLRDALLAEFGELIDTGAFTNGPAVREFEDAFAAWCGMSDSVGLGSGLDALRLALQAGGLEPGDEVVVPANTFVATLEAVTQAGGVPVVVDAQESDWNIDPGAAASAVSPRTRFLLPVHLYGQLADMHALRRIGIPIVEDACQAHGGERDGVRAGAGGLAGAFSFYPGKNLGAMGDAGALVTDDAELAARVRALREHGQRAKYEHEWEGWTARLDTIQAIVLLRKLALLDEWTAQRRDAAAFYLEALDGVGDLVLPPVPPASSPVWHLFVVRTADPVALADHLRTRGVGTGRHYPVPVHLAPAYARLGYRRGEFPVAERLADECLSLPMFPGLADAQLAAVVDGVKSYFGG